MLNRARRDGRRDRGFEMKRVLTVAALGMLGGCAMAPTQQDLALQQQAQATIPHCTSQRQCEGEWAAAREWVTANCAMKIQTITDSYIDTYNSVDGDAGLACTVTKDPMPKGGYSIAIAATCDNMFGCVPNQWSAIVAFNKTVNDAGEQFAGQ